MKKGGARRSLVASFEAYTDSCCKLRGDFAEMLHRPLTSPLGPSAQNELGESYEAQHTKYTQHTDIIKRTFRARTFCVLPKPER